MWYPLANFPAGSGPGGRTCRPMINTGPYDFVHVLEDIQSLNDRAQRAELEITAISIHQYPYVAQQYAMTSCGASMGDGYGPMVVAPQGKTLTIDDLANARIAVHVDEPQRVRVDLGLGIVAVQGIANRIL